MSYEERKDYCYLRLSKEDKEVMLKSKNESDSIVNQRIVIMNFVKEKDDISNDIIELVDDGYSGTNGNRPAFQKLMNLVEENKVRTLIVKDLSRLAREYIVTGQYMDKFFPLHGVRFISINDHYDSNDSIGQTSGEGIAVTNIINQYYSYDISSKIKSVVDRKKRQGEFVYGTAPYGYKKGEKKNTIVVDDEAAIIVKYIFWLACEGNTISQIARTLNEQKVITPSIYLQSVRGKYKTREFWTYESVRNIMDNRIYTGDTEAFKSSVKKVGSNQVKQIPKENREIIENTHEAIITKEAYFKASEVIKSNKKTKTNQVHSVLTTYLVCGSCGGRLSKGRPTNKNYKCPNHRYLVDGRCAEVIAKDEQIQEMVLKAINKQIEIAENIAKELKRTKKVVKSELQRLKEEVIALSKVTKSLQDKKVKLYEELVSEKCSKSEYLEQKDYVTKQIELNEEMLHNVEEKITALTLEEANKIRPKSKPEMKKEVLTIEMMKAFVSKIIVEPTGEINIIWNFKDDYLS